jgi:hypothetical protein
MMLMIAVMLLWEQKQGQVKKREEELAAACSAHDASKRVSHSPGPSFLLNQTLIKVGCNNKKQPTPCFDTNSYLKST